MGDLGMSMCCLLYQERKSWRVEYLFFLICNMEEYIKSIEQAGKEVEEINKTLEEKIQSYHLQGDLYDEQFGEKNHISEEEVRLLRAMMNECKSLSEEERELCRKSTATDSQEDETLESSIRMLKIENMELEKKVADMKRKVERCKMEYLSISPFKKMTESQQKALDELNKRLEQLSDSFLEEEEEGEMETEDGLSFPEFYLTLKAMKREYGRKLKVWNGVSDDIDIEATRIHRSVGMGETNGNECSNTREALRTETERRRNGS